MSAPVTPTPSTPWIWRWSDPRPGPDKGGHGPGRGRRSSPMSWRWGDRLVLALAWSIGALLCLVAAAIVLYIGVRGIQYLSPSLIFSRPQASLSQAGSGGFLDPLFGTVLLTIIGLAISLPLGVASAVWIAEYGQGGRARQALARVIESSIEIVAGTPDVVLAIFGLAVFQLQALAIFSFKAESGGVFGRSFIAAGAIMSLLALPSIYAATRDGLQSVPSQMREAAFALGKTRITTIRRVLIPNVMSNIATGATLGISRIIGSTAIVLIGLGSFLRTETVGSIPVISTLRGTGSTLTSYIYENSAAGEGGAPQKAFAAAFVLLVFVLALNLLVEWIGRSQERASGLSAIGAVV